jgi:hypothetical protein
MGFIDKCKDFFFSSPVPKRRADGPYEVTASDFDVNPLVGKGGNAYTLRQFQTLPSVNMLMGNGRIPVNFFKPLGQNNLVALRPAGPPQDVVGIPVGEVEFFTEPTEV